MNIDNLQLILSYEVKEDYVVVEMWADDLYVCDVSRKKEGVVLSIYPREDGQPHVMDSKMFMAKLQSALEEFED